MATQISDTYTCKESETCRRSYFNRKAYFKSSSTEESESCFYLLQRYSKDDWEILERDSEVGKMGQTVGAWRRKERIVPMEGSYEA